MQSRFAFIFFILLVCHACSSTNYYADTQNALNDTVDQIYQATLNHDAKTVYQLLSSDVQKLYTDEEFSDFFTHHYDVFLEYVIRTRDNIQIQPYTIEAHRTEDPCGYLSMTLQYDNQWKLNNIPEQSSIRDIDEYKQSIVNKLRTEQFIQILNTYSSQHSELTLEIVRQIRRALLFLEKENVSFYGQRALISFDDKVSIVMSCTKEGWILDNIHVRHD